jgi:hypothetical protein
MSDYIRKIAALLEDKDYKKSKDSTGTIERKTVLLLKERPIVEEVCQQL